MEHLKVAVVIFPGVELVDMNGPIDVFLHANRAYKTSFEKPRYEVFTVAETNDLVEAEGKAVVIKPAMSIKECTEADIVVIPGRIDFTAAADSIPASQAIIDWIAMMAGNKNTTIMSVCVGLYSLAATGMLDGKKATTHYLAMSYAQKTWPKIKLIKNVRCVHDGQFVTTGGITSGIDGALYLVKHNDGETVAQMVADIMVYNPEAPLPPYTLLPPYPSMD